MLVKLLFLGLLGYGYGINSGSGDIRGINHGGFDNLPNGCPVDFHINLHLPHESDCNLFYQCNFGNKILIRCAAGLHFNPRLEVCDWPNVAGCESGNNSGGGNGDGGSDGGGGEGDGGGGGNGGNGVDGGNEGSGGGEIGGEGEGGGGGGGNGGDGGNGGSGGGGGSEGGGASGGGAWGGGDGGNGGGGGSGGIGDGGSGGIGDGGGGGGSNQTVKCQDQCYVAHWLHETDCDKFWRCEGNRTVLGICSEGLQFNTTTQTCDFTCNVNCERKVIQSTAQRDGLKLFLPWDKVDKIIKVSRRGKFQGFKLLAQ